MKDREAPRTWGRWAVGRALAGLLGAVLCLTATTDVAAARAAVGRPGLAPSAATIRPVAPAALVSHRSGPAARAVLGHVLDLVGPLDPSAPVALTAVGALLAPADSVDSTDAPASDARAPPGQGTA